MPTDPDPSARFSDTPIVVCANQKGGVGKTTIALGLCAQTAFAHGQALLVDTDPQASSYDLTALLDDPGYEVVHELNPGQLGKIRSVRNYDLIVVDLPGSLEGQEILGTVLRYASFVIVPYDHEPASLAPTMRTARYVAERKVPYAVLVTNVDPRLGAEHLEDAWGLLDREHIPRFRTAIRHYRVWSNAIRDGVPITRYAGGRYATAARTDLSAVMTELLLRMRPGAPEVK
jgi:chromosome partitioning protein